MPDEVDELLTRAEDRLRAARHLLAGSHFSDAVSRAYYAMYFAATALLLSKGVATKTHSGLVGMLYPILDTSFVSSPIRAAPT